MGQLRFLELSGTVRNLLKLAKSAKLEPERRDSSIRYVSALARSDLTLSRNLGHIHQCVVYSDNVSTRSESLHSTQKLRDYLIFAASSLSSRSALSSNYTVVAASTSAALRVGPWKVERATHNTSGKLVSIWSCDKSSLTLSTGAFKRDAHHARRLERAFEVLKKGTASLSRLRHPCILEVVEPMEESRSAITFATEPVNASLRQAIAASSNPSGISDNVHLRRSADRVTTSSTSSQHELELDEVEIQKGLSQLAKGLQFLHESAKTIHGNLTPEAVVINAKGDWKLHGFGHSIRLFTSDGAQAKWEFPEFDHGLPATIQRDYDYIAPEYILDESDPMPANDMYSLGCILHAIHTHSGPPFQNRNSLTNARTNIEEGLSRGMVRPLWRKLSEEAQSALGQLVTRYPSQRLSAAGFLAHGYFSSLLVSTLNFLARDAFASQSTEAQAGFLKGLVNVLPQFSDKVNRRKVLPSLLEETRKPTLVPFLLPNVMAIGRKMDADAFRLEILPYLTPLFRIKDPPQAILALLDSLLLFTEKCAPAVFREDVMPLVYLSLESDNPTILDRALKIIPGLCDTLDYSTVKQTLFPKITALFTKTTMLSVKVAALICFYAMTPILDKFTLTEKLVPLIGKMKTREPAVMLASLEVYSRVGTKVDINAIATLILPQLWAWSMAPLLHQDQFAKFMAVIKTLGQRVETEQTNALKELKRLEESTSSERSNDIGSTGQVVDFETLVRGGAGVNVGRGVNIASDLLGDEGPRSTPPLQSLTPPAPPVATTSFTGFKQAAAIRTSSSGTLLGPRHPSSPSINSSDSYSAGAASSPFSPMNTDSLALPPSSKPLSSFSALEPVRTTLASSTTSLSHNTSYATGKPNYESLRSSISVPMQSPTFGAQPKNPWASAVKPATSSVQQWNILQPTVVTSPKKPQQDFGVWSDFDPLK